MSLVVLAVVMAACQAYGQCPGGTCPMQPAARAPQSSLHYEQPAGHKSAVCRVVCEGQGSGRSLGSGVFVQFSDSQLVLTANHVVRDGGAVHVQLVNGQSYPAKVVATDTVWDVAVLWIGKVDGAPVAELAYAEAGLQQPGAQLESCGYGPDGRLAVNTGVFLEYRGSSKAPGGPPDWMSISGQARGGDSGGPIFDSQGRVVGILWGTDGTEVIGSQVGRLTVVLKQGVQQLAAEQTVCGPGGCRPPSGGLVPICRPRQPTAPPTPPALPIAPPAPPQVIVQSDPAVGRALGSMAQSLDQIVVNTTPPPKQLEKESASPVVAGVIMLGSLVAGCFVYFGTQKG